VAGCSGGGGGDDAEQADEILRPDHWDARVADLVEFVEDKRELRFKHPVEVEFLETGEFRKEVTQERGDLTEEEETELAALEGLTRALGLISGDFDLLEAGNDLAGEGILAYYEPETKKVTVKGTGEDLSVAVQATVVHELTHALQDQHFDLGRLGELATDGEDSAFQAVVEGDATRVENLWVAELSERDQAAYAKETDQVTDEAQTGLADLPEWLITLFGAPYALGLPFAEAVHTEGGVKALDRAFEKPPGSEEQIVSPARYLAGDPPAKVAAPKLGDGRKKVDEADFGVLGWVVVLAERLPSELVMKAVDGWGGDAYLTYTDGGRTCVDVHVVGDDPADTDEFAEAFSAWAEGQPGASADRDGDAAVLRSCEAGGDATAPARPAGAAGAEKLLTRLATRSTLFAGTLGQGASPRDAACYADAFIGSLTDEDLAATEATPDLEAAATKAAQDCFTQ
jgi:hypothetical protein